MDKKTVQQIQEFLAPKFGCKPEWIEVGENSVTVNRPATEPPPAPARVARATTRV